MNEARLVRAVRDAGIDVPPTWFEEVGSTNTAAMDLAARGAPAWSVVATGHQTAGRGRLGRTWSDVPGEGLLCSVVLRPALRPDDAPLVTLAAATAMVEAGGSSVLRSKWPNDLVAGERKVGGILAEAHVRSGEVEHVVVGTGVNVGGDPPAEAGDAATSLRAAGGEDDDGALLERYLRAFRRRLEERFPDWVLIAYAEVCATIGRRVRATTTEGRRVEGLAVGLDERGGLVIEGGDGPVTVAFGEVEHLR